MTQPLEPCPQGGEQEAENQTVDPGVQQSKWNGTGQHHPEIHFKGAHDGQVGQKIVDHRAGQSQPHRTQQRAKSPLTPPDAQYQTAQGAPQNTGRPHAQGLPQEQERNRQSQR